MTSNLTLYEQLLPVLQQIHRDLYNSNHGNGGHYHDNVANTPESTTTPSNGTASNGLTSANLLPLVYVLIVISYYAGIIFMCMIGCGVYKKVSGYQLYEKFVVRKEIKEQRKEAKERHREELKRMSSRNSEDEELIANTQGSPSVGSHVFFEIVPNGGTDWDSHGQQELRKNYSVPDTFQYHNHAQPSPPTPPPHPPIFQLGEDG